MLLVPNSLWNHILNWIFFSILLFHFFCFFASHIYVLEIFNDFPEKNEICEFVQSLFDSRVENELRSGSDSCFSADHELHTFGRLSTMERSEIGLFFSVQDDLWVRKLLAVWLESEESVHFDTDIMFLVGLHRCSVLQSNRFWDFPFFWDFAQWRSHFLNWISGGWSIWSTPECAILSSEWCSSCLVLFLVSKQLMANKFMSKEVLLSPLGFHVFRWFSGLFSVRRS